MSVNVKPETPIDKHIFTRKLNEYKNRLNPDREYIRQMARASMVYNGGDYETSVRLVKQVLKEDSNIKNPLVTYNHFKDNGDKEVVEVKLTNYIKDTFKSNEVIVPSFTTYTHHSKRKSLHSMFLEKNIALRKSDKKNAAKYKQEDDLDKYVYFDVLQKVRKIFNNSLSGAYASKSTGLYHPSSHYSLTSTTRLVASTGNAISEYMISGNKHFRTPEIVFNYISTIITELNYKDMEYIIGKYKLTVPSTDDLHRYLMKSTKAYWVNEEKSKEIKHFISRLTDIQKVGVLYVNDLHALRVFNENLVRDLLTDMTKKVEGEVKTPVKILYSLPEGLSTLVNLIFADELKGKDSTYSNLIEKDPALVQSLALTGLNILRALTKIKPIIKTLFCTDISPIDIVYIKEMLREAIVLSDTDSTCASYDDWVNWYYGKYDFGTLGGMLSGAVMTIVTQTVDHHLKLISKNMNIDEDYFDLLKMKNEYYWNTFIATNVSKHYFANTCVVEGNVYKIPELETKGVHLIAAKSNSKIRGIAVEMMKDINDTLTRGDKLSMNKYIQIVKDAEQWIIDEVYKGNIDIVSLTKVKGPKSYKNPMQSPYMFYELWVDVFEDKYGKSFEPEYTAIELPTTLTTKGKMNKFLDSLEPEIGGRFKAFMKKHKKDKIINYKLPLLNVGEKGIPEELRPVIDVDKIVLTNTRVLYIILESIGYISKPNMKLLDL